MREIKFRVWDWKEMRIVDFSMLDETDAIWFDVQEHEVMQSTWLKDKEWTEIYEGDIIEIDDESRKMYDVVWSDWSWVKKYQEVWFQDWCAMTRRSIHEEVMWRKFDTYLWLTNKYCKVIWNIYEPNLLPKE